MRLKNYQPAGREIVLHLKQYAQIGSIITPDSTPDKVLKVLAVGPMCECTKVGDHVLLGDVGVLQMELEDEKGKNITVVLTTEFSIRGYYTPDPDETRYYVAVKGSNGAGVNDTRELNIIDNPGIEKSSYLKEEAQNKIDLQMP